MSLKTYCCTLRPTAFRLGKTSALKLGALGLRASPSVSPRVVCFMCFSKKLGATPSQVALAWVLRRSPVMLPIPGTSRLPHLEEDVAAAVLNLSEADFATLSRAGNS